MFNRETTVEQVLEGADLTGRRIVITGASSGLGLESTRALASKGAEIVMLARSPEFNDKAAARVRQSIPDAQLTTGQLDLADLASVRRCARELLERRVVEDPAHLRGRRVGHHRAQVRNRLHSRCRPAN